MRVDKLIGSIVGGRFKVVRVVGEGGMGAVYEAEHTTLARRFALKVLHKELGRDKRFVERFRREAVAASRVEHPNIMTVSDFGQLESGEFYLVMEYLEGQGLDAVIRRKGRIPLPRAIPILMQVADGLEYAHRAKIIHRDLKPENVLLCDIRDQPDFVKLLDFGIAKIQSQSFAGRLTLQGQVFGTAEYVSPEQAMDREVDSRSDLYSLGVLAFEMTTGTVPFEGSPAEVLTAHVQKKPPAPSMRMPPGEFPPMFDSIVLRLLTKNPDDRYQSGAQFRRDLVRLRGMIAAAAKGLYDGKGRRELRRNIVDSGGWRPLGTRVQVDVTLRNIPQEAMREISAAVAMADARSGRVSAQGSSTPRTTGPVERWRNQQDLRRQLHKTLRKMGLTLAETAHAPPETREVLSVVLVGEEEVAAMSNEISRLEQNFERIRFEVGQRETALRHALMDLGLERARRVQEAANPAVIQDLDYQIGELDRRLRETLSERQKRIRELVEAVERVRGERETRERELAERYLQLGQLVDGVRQRVDGQEFARIFEELDEVRALVSRARQSIAPHA